MFCRSCGENIPIDSVFCPNCGKNLLEVTERQIPEPEPEPVTETEEEDRPPFRFRRRRPAPDEEVDPAEDADLQEVLPSQRAPRDYAALLARLSLKRVLWAMGLVFSAVGFIVGLAGHLDPALAWIFFGLVLVIAGPHAPEGNGASASPDVTRHATVTEEEPTRATEEMRD